MNVLRYTLGEWPKVVIPLGVAGENLATRIEVDCTPWLADHPAGVIEMLVQQPDGNIYPALVTMEGNVATWTLKSSDTGVAGYGKVEVRCICSESTQQDISRTARTHLYPSINQPDGGDPAQPWVDGVYQASADAKTATNYAISSANAAKNSATSAGQHASAAEASATVAGQHGSAAEASATEAARQAGAAEGQARAATENAAEAEKQAAAAAISAADAAAHATAAASSADAAGNAAQRAEKAAEGIWDAVAQTQGGAPPIIATAAGRSIAVQDSAARAFAGLHVYGRTTQEATPTPDAPVDLIPAGAGGFVTISVSDGEAAQTLQLATADGLAGVPVTTGGTHTDHTGQMWIADEIDLTRGVHVQRIHRVRLTSTSHAWATTSTSGRYAINNPRPSMLKGAAPMSTHCVGRTTIYSTAGNVANNAGTQLVFSTDLPTLADWKAWLDGNEVWLHYALATPVETPLTDEELVTCAALRTYNGTTVITNDADADMRVQYVADTKAYVDGREGAYELIETIAVDGDMQIDRTAEPGGAPWNFSDIIVELHTTNGSTVAGHAYVTLYCGSIKVCQYGLSNAVAASGECYCAVGASIDKGAAATWATDAGMGPQSMTALKRKPETTIVQSNVTRMIVYASVAWPEGSSITIKGVRA